MAFTWNPSGLEQIVKAGSNISGSESHINELRARVKELDDKITWYSLESQFDLESIPYQTRGSFVNKKYYENIRKAVDLLDDNKSCNTNYVSNLTSENQVYNSILCGTDNSTENEVYNSILCGTDNITEDATYNTSECGTHNTTENEVYNSTLCGTDNSTQNSSYNTTQCSTNNTTQNSSYYTTQYSPDNSSQCGSNNSTLCGSNNTSQNNTANSGFKR